MTWFQDGTRLLVSGAGGPKDRTGVWVAPLRGGALTHIRDDAWGAAPSPDGTQVAFRRASAAEIWVMKTTGEGARKIVSANPGEWLHEITAWSPDGRFIAFGRRDRPHNWYTIESHELATGRNTVLVSDPRAEYFCWSRNGRLYYERMEDPPNQASANLWEIGVDARSGGPRGKPRRVTHWRDFNFKNLEASASGLRLSFVRHTSGGIVQLAGLADGGTRLTGLRRATYDQWVNWPSGWTAGGGRILFYSNRQGRMGIYQQSLCAREAGAIVNSPEDAVYPLPSPDGRWILYLSWPDVAAGHGRSGGRLMRVRQGGAVPEVVFPVAGHPDESPPEPIGRRAAPVGAGDPRFRCPQTGKGDCVLSEREGDQIIFTGFDPVRGRRGVLGRMRVDWSTTVFWDLSPDGRWIAAGECREAGGNIRLIPLAGGRSREIPVAGWNNLISVAWAADGTALYLTGWASREPPLLRVSLNGDVRLLHKGAYFIENVIPSPDGRLLAFVETFAEGNAWIVERPQ